MWCFPDGGEDDQADVWCFPDGGEDDQADVCCFPDGDEDDQADVWCFPERNTIECSTVKTPRYRANRRCDEKRQTEVTWQNDRVMTIV